MTQTIILALGTEAATSSIFTVGSGEAVKVGIYSGQAGAVLPIDTSFVIEEVTPGAPNFVGYLNSITRSCSISAPGTYRVRLAKSYTGSSFGVFLDKA